MATVIVHQNPNLVKVGGYEKTGKSINNNTKVSFGIPFVNNRHKLELKPEQIKIVEDYYHIKLDSVEGRAFYSDMSFDITDKVISWDLTQPEILIKYGAAISAGILAEDRKAIENPMCQAMFYVFNSEDETNYISEYNELRGDVLYELTKMKKEDADNIIKLAKYMFDSYEKYTPSKAYNKLVEYAEKHTKTNKTLNEIKKILDGSWEDIDLTVIIQECIAKNIIIKNKRQFFMNRENLTEYGKNIDEIKAFLLNNPDELGDGKAGDKVYALRRLLKQG